MNTWQEWMQVTDYLNSKEVKDKGLRVYVASFARYARIFTADIMFEKSVTFYNTLDEVKKMVSDLEELSTVKAN